MSHIESIKHLLGGPSDFALGWILLLISSGITIILFVFNCLKWLIERVKNKGNFLKKLKYLDTETHISYFITLLGNPVFIDKIGVNQEYIFVSNYFYVQALTDVDGKVSLFSVTTRKANFNPILTDQLGDFRVQLGKSNFLQLGEPQNVITSGDHGAITYYAESYYLGYAGAYRTYFFSINPNGFNQLEDVPLSFIVTTEVENPETIKKFRKNNTVNTYTVSSLTGPDGYKDLDTNFRFGPGYHQIRAFAKK